MCEDEFAEEGLSDEKEEEAEEPMDTVLLLYTSLSVLSGQYNDSCKVLDYLEAREVTCWCVDMATLDYVQVRALRERYLSEAGDSLPLLMVGERKYFYDELYRLMEDNELAKIININQALSTTHPPA